MAGFVVNEITSKSKKAYFYIMNAGKNATQNDIERNLYHNLPVHQHNKRIYDTKKYRRMRNNKVRRYSYKI